MIKGDIFCVQLYKGSCVVQQNNAKIHDVVAVADSIQIVRGPFNTTYISNIPLIIISHSVLDINFKTYSQ